MDFDQQESSAPAGNYTATTTLQQTIYPNLQVSTNLVIGVYPAFAYGKSNDATIYIWAKGCILIYTTTGTAI